MATYPPLSKTVFFGISRVFIQWILSLNQTCCWPTELLITACSTVMKTITSVSFGSSIFQARVLCISMCWLYSFHYTVVHLVLPGTLIFQLLLNIENRKNKEIWKKQVIRLLWLNNGTCFARPPSLIHRHYCNTPAEKTIRESMQIWSPIKLRN